MTVAPSGRKIASFSNVNYGHRSWIPREPGGTENYPENLPDKDVFALMPNMGVEVTNPGDGTCIYTARLHPFVSLFFSIEHIHTPLSYTISRLSYSLSSENLYPYIFGNTSIHNVFPHNLVILTLRT